VSLQISATNEQARLDSLYRYDILGSDAEEIFDEITRFASRLFQVPAAYIGFIDTHHVRLKSKTGLTENEIRRDRAFCPFIISNPEKVLIIPDTVLDPKYSSLQSGFRFFSGAALVTQNGHVLGSLSILDKIPRSLNSEQAALLQNLARQVMILLELRLRETQQSRKRTEEALRKSEEKYRILFEESPDIVFICAPDGKFLEINSTAVKLLGAAGKNEILSKKLDDFCWDSDVQKRHHTALKSEGYLKDYELTLKTLTGDKLHVLETCTALYENENIIGYRGFLRDITNVRGLQEQLFQVQKIEAIGQLAGGVAHDFNNILMAITAFTELTISKLDERSPLRDTLSEILKSADQGASLTQQMLAFSRRQIMQPKIIELNSILHSMKNFLKRLLGEDIELNMILDQTLGRIKADPSKLEQVIMNLAINARDAMPEGGKLIIETSNTEMDEEYTSHHAGSRIGRYVLLTVSDTGTGMSEATMARIFEPFFTTKEHGRGTGLGLSTVYGIVKQSEGYITVYSEPGHGSAFRVYFPRIDEEIQKDLVVAQNVSLKGSETILVVDDNEPVRSSMSALLEMHGYRVLQAANGPESIELLRRNSEAVHLMITDIVMPAMSGLTLAQSLREMRPNLRVLCMSGYSREAFERQGRIEMGTDFLSKPVSMGVLLSKVREILDRLG
jgi:PAS domain S-box-containing protein